MLARAADATAGRLASLPSATKRSLSDQVLIARIAGRDKRAMQVLYARHHVHLYRFVRALIDDETRAEDIVCDVFLDLWRHANLIQKQREVSIWLLASAHEKAMRWLPRHTSGKPGGSRGSDRERESERNLGSGRNLACPPESALARLPRDRRSRLLSRNINQRRGADPQSSRDRMVNARKQLAMPKSATCDTGR